MTLTDKSAHLAWCALVALALARRDGAVHSPAGENLFLTRWLATAQKQRRFPREVAPDIAWLLNQGRQYGSRARMATKLEYLWRSCSGLLSAQSDLFRLTYAMETAKDLHWHYRLLNDREWAGRYAVTLSAGVNGIYLSRTCLDVAFDDDGRQTTPLMARVTGDVAGLAEVLESCGWQAEPEPDAALPWLYSLTARQGVSEKEG